MTFSTVCTRIRFLVGRILKPVLFLKTENLTQEISGSFDRDQVIKDILLELFRIHEQPVAFGYNPSEAVVIDVLFGESVNSVITKL